MYYSDTMCRYHFCRPWRCNANGESTLCAFWYYETIRMLFVDVEVDEYFIFVLLQGCRCFFAFHFIFSLKFLNKQNMEKWIHKTISTAAKHWKSFSALFSIAQPNSLKAFFLSEIIFTRNYFTLKNSFTWSQTHSKWMDYFFLIVWVL